MSIRTSSHKNTRDSTRKPWLAFFHLLIKQVPEVLRVSPLCISVVNKGESWEICSPGFSLAYSASSVLLLQIPAKIKAQMRKLSLWASTRPQLLCVYNTHNCTGRKGTVSSPSASHGWPRSAAQTTSLNILLQRTPCCWRWLPGDGVLCKSICNKRPNSCTFCQYIYYTSAAFPLRCSSD